MYKKTVQLDVNKFAFTTCLYFFNRLTKNIIKKMAILKRFNVSIINSGLCNRNGLTHNEH